MNKLFQKLFSRRPAQSRRLELMAEGDKAAAFLSGPGTELWRAVLAELDEFTVEVSDRALDERQSEALIRTHLGGQSALLEFKEKLLRREDAARRQREEEKEPD